MKNISLLLILSSLVLGCGSDTVLLSGPAEAVTISHDENKLTVWPTVHSEISNGHLIWQREDLSGIEILERPSMTRRTYDSIYVTLYADWVKVEFQHHENSPKRTSILKRDEVVKILMK